MQNIRNLLVLLLFFTGLAASAQREEIIRDYINTYKNIAIKEMQRTGVPASVKLAQGIHETMAGTSDLVTKSNNHFGIKCKSNWKGESVSHDDDARGECFRKYGSSEDSYRDHSDFLLGNTRYASLFKLDPLDYSAWAYGLKKAGYATNPKYPQIIIRLIEDYNLQDYTLIAMGQMPDKEEVVAEATQDTDHETGEPAVAVAVRHEREPDEHSQVVAAVIKQPVYPSGEFKINETKVIYARAGTPFLAIAGQYEIPLARLFEFNDRKESEVLEKDQLVYLQRKRKTGRNEFHVVKPGETLFDIAQAEAIRIESLLEYNLLEIDMQPAVGERLSLRNKAQARPRLANGSTSTGLPAARELLAYTVQPQETIYSISKKYNVRIEDIMQWNQLNNYDLKVGQQLKIYQ